MFDFKLSQINLTGAWIVWWNLIPRTLFSKHCFHREGITALSFNSSPLTLLASPLATYYTSAFLAVCSVIAKTCTEVAMRLLEKRLCLDMNVKGALVYSCVDICRLLSILLKLLPVFVWVRATLPTSLPASFSRILTTWRNVLCILPHFLLGLRLVLVHFFLKHQNHLLLFIYLHYSTYIFLFSFLINFKYNLHTIKLVHC